MRQNASCSRWPTRTRRSIRGSAETRGRWRPGAATTEQINNVLASRVFRGLLDAHARTSRRDAAGRCGRHRERGGRGAVDASFIVPSVFDPRSRRRCRSGARRRPRPPLRRSIDRDRAVSPGRRRRGQMVDVSAKDVTAASLCVGCGAYHGRSDSLLRANELPKAMPLPRHGSRHHAAKRTPIWCRCAPDRDHRCHR